MTLSAAPTLPDIEVQPRHAAASANTIGVQFFYHTGIAQDVFSNVRLCGSWDDSGLPGTARTTTPMQQHTSIDSCPMYTATIEFPDTQVGTEYSWGVIADSGSGHDLWAIPTEVPDPDSAARRVDQTTSIHFYNALHADGPQVDAANACGAKFQRELTRTLRLVKPHVFLIAEDYSGWQAVTAPADLGGLGFDAIWYADFYHNLSGDTGHGLDCANLLSTAAIGDDRALAMGVFASKLAQTNYSTVVYPESHDEAGNSTWNGHHSGRTPSIAVGYAPLVGDTRRYGQARTRFSAGMALLSAGTPMFFMGEECGDTELYRYNDFLWHRMDFQGAAAGDGHHLFSFFRGLITLRRTVPALRSGTIDILHSHDGNRVLAFTRDYGPDHVLVMASLNNQPFSSGYAIDGVADGVWREVFNSDATAYGGWNDGNGGADLPSSSGRFTAVLPRAGFVVFRRL